jgi:hypothetical protein
MIKKNLNHFFGNQHAFLMLGPLMEFMGNFVFGLIFKTHTPWPTMHCNYFPTKQQQSKTKKIMLHVIWLTSKPSFTAHPCDKHRGSRAKVVHCVEEELLQSKIWCVGGQWHWDHQHHDGKDMIEDRHMVPEKTLNGKDKIIFAELFLQMHAVSGQPPTRAW